MNKEQFSQIVDDLIAGYDYNIKKGTSELVSYQAAKYIAIEKFNKLTKRRPYLFLITTQHNDEYTSNSMVYYLEPNQDPKEFKEESAAHLRSVYGEGTISLRSIKI
tara:strand:+ start:564 stop:881 length:318 start_codon:yes stop_codon:yes gene_type:complete